MVKVPMASPAPAIKYFDKDIIKINIICGILNYNKVKLKSEFFRSLFVIVQTLS